MPEPNPGESPSRRPVSMPSLVDLSQGMSLDPPAEPMAAPPQPRPSKSPFPTAAYQPVLELDDPALTPAPADFNELTTSKVYPTIPGYTIVGELARRRWGVVYQAADQQRRRTVALKVIEMGGTVGAEMLARFQAEAATVGGLQQPGVVEVFEMNAWRGQDFMVQEYVPAPTLAQFLRGEPQPADASARYVLQLADTIAAMHQRKIVHGDLQPAHLFVVPPNGDPEPNRFGVLREANVPLVYGFGTPLFSQGPREGWREQATKGIHRYMPPERLQTNFKAWKPTVDVYALGAILHELLTGKPPFAEVASGDLAVSIINVTPPPPSARHKAVPTALDTIVSRCLRKQPKERYPTVAAFAQDLRRYLAKQSLAPSESGRGSNWKLAAGVLGFGLLTFGSAVGVLLWGPEVMRWLSRPRTAVAETAPMKSLSTSRPAEPTEPSVPAAPAARIPVQPGSPSLATEAWSDVWPKLAQRILASPELGAFPAGAKDALGAAAAAASPAEVIRHVLHAESLAHGVAPEIRNRHLWQPAADAARQAPATTDAATSEALVAFFTGYAEFARSHASLPGLERRVAALALTQALHRYPFRDARRADLHVRRAKAFIEVVGWGEPATARTR